jgi:hypothetical protein
MVLTHLLIGPPPQKLPGSSWFLSFKTRINDPHLDHQHFVLFFLNNISTLQIEKPKNLRIFRQPIKLEHAAGAYFAELVLRCSPVSSIVQSLVLAAMQGYRGR